MIREEEDVEPGPITLPGNETITVSEADAEPDDSEEKAPPAREPKTGQWTKKKNERQNAIKDNEELRRSHSELRDLVKGLEERSSRQMTELIAALRPQPQTPAGPPPEVQAIESQIEGIMAQQKAVLQEIAADKPGAEEKYYKLDRQRLALIARAEGAAQGWGKKEVQQERSGLSPEQAARYAVIQQEFPDFDGNEKWSKVAGAFRRGLLEAGHPDNLATDRLAIGQAARQLGIGPRAAPPSERTRQAYGGPPAGGRAPAARGQRSMQIPENLIKGSGLSRQQVAEALFSDDE